MVNPLLTVLLDAVLIGSALVALVAIVADERARRRRGVVACTDGPRLVTRTVATRRTRAPRYSVGARPSHLRRRQLPRVA